MANAAAGRRSKRTPETATRSRAKKPASAPPAAACTRTTIAGLVGGQAGTSGAMIEVEIVAPIDRVWDALVNETREWWRKEFHTSRYTKAFVLEPFVGGRGYEDCGSGTGALWFNVLVIEPPNLLEVVSHLSPRYGGPLTAITTFELRAQAKHTIVTVTDAAFGHIQAGRENSLRDGWRLLIGDGLKPWVETGRGN